MLYARSRRSRREREEEERRHRKTLEIVKKMSQDTDDFTSFLHKERSRFIHLETEISETVVEREGENVTNQLNETMSNLNSTGRMSSTMSMKLTKSGKHRRKSTGGV